MRRNTKTMYEWRKAYKGGNPYQSSFTADTGTYRLCVDKVVCKRVYEVERILLN